MLRVVSETLRRAWVGRALVDVGVVLLAVYAGVLIDASVETESLRELGTRGVSLAAGIVFLNGASGFYESVGHRRLGWVVARSLVALAVALPLTYFVFLMNPAGLGDSGKVLESARR